MNAKAFLESQGRAIPPHPITLRLLHPEDPSRVAEYPAVLRFVPDRLRLAALDAAAESLAKLPTPPSAKRRDAEEAYQLLVHAVRQAGAPSTAAFETVEQARSMLVEDEAIRTMNEYQRYRWVNFPETLSEADAKRIAEDARNFSLGDLLRSYGFWAIQRALPSLAIAYGASLTATSSPTPSASTSPAA